MSLNRLLAEVPSVSSHYERAQPLNLKITDLRTFVVDAANDEPN